MKTIALVTILLGSVASTLGQTFPTQSGTTTATNILTPVPLQGTLQIDYNFYVVPDTMDVYYDGADIFSSGLISGGGQFDIPYGPGSSDSITIIMDQEGVIEPGDDVWTYTPTIVVPEPDSLALLIMAGLILTKIWHFRTSVGRRSGDASPTSLTQKT